MYPLVMTNIAIENGPFIVDLPIQNGGSFHSYVAVYQRVTYVWLSLYWPTAKFSIAMKIPN